jgi:[ribosomal protein S5]-alanine N-acetyltransferase
MYPSPHKDITSVESFINDSILQNEKGLNFQLVITNINREFIGLVGLHNIDRDIPEFGIWIKESAWGNGFGKEAIHGIYYAIQNEISYIELNYPVDINNSSSIKIPQTLNGTISAKYDLITPSGKILHCVDYRIK